MAKWVFAFLVLLFLAFVWATSQKPLWRHGMYDVSHCRAQMANFGQAVDHFGLATEGRLPESLAELTRPAGAREHPFITRIPPDPWGNEYEYQVIDADGTETRSDRDPMRGQYRIRSFGEDGQRGTDDDLVFPDPEHD